jgi:uncharacterized membrane protein
VAGIIAAMPEEQPTRTRTGYLAIAGRSVDRLAALSDGIFAIAMTLLVLDLKVPVLDVVHGQQPLWADGAMEPERALWSGLGHLAPRLLPYVMSFLILGIFWVGQQTQLDNFVRSDRNLTWIHLAFLLAVTFMPFSTSLLAEFITLRLALVVYWLNLVVLGAVLLGSVRYAHRAGLMDPEQADEVRSATARRIVRGQTLYLAAMTLCVISTYATIVALILLQLASALAIRPFNRA